MAGPGSWLTRNHKTRTNYGTGLTKCLPTCQCRSCRKRKAEEEQKKQGKQKRTDVTTNDTI